MIHFLFYVNTYLVSVLISACYTKVCFKHYIIFKLYYKNQASILKSIPVTIFTLFRCSIAVHRRIKNDKSKLKLETVSKTVTRGDKKVLKAAARLQGRWWVCSRAGNGPSCLYAHQRSRYYVTGCQVVFYNLYLYINFFYRSYSLACFLLFQQIC